MKKKHKGKCCLVSCPMGCTNPCECRTIEITDKNRGNWKLIYKEAITNISNSPFLRKGKGTTQSL